MSSDALIRYEEDHFDELIDKFIEKYRDEWKEFVMKVYENNTCEQCLEIFPSKEVENE